MAYGAGASCWVLPQSGGSRAWCRCLVLSCSLSVSPTADGGSTAGLGALLGRQRRPRHPPTLAMVLEALRARNEKRGTSVVAIKRYILAKYPAVDAVRLKYLLKQALTKGLSRGFLVRPHNSSALGATGRFKVRCWPGALAERSRRLGLGRPRAAAPLTFQLAPEKLQPSKAPGPAAPASAEAPKPARERTAKARQRPVAAGAAGKDGKGRRQQHGQVASGPNALVWAAGAAPGAGRPSGRLCWLGDPCGWADGSLSFRRHCGRAARSGAVEAPSEDHGGGCCRVGAGTCPLWPWQHHDGAWGSTHCGTLRRCFPPFPSSRGRRFPRSPRATEQSRQVLAEATGPHVLLARGCRHLAAPQELGPRRRQWHGGARLWWGPGQRARARHAEPPPRRRGPRRRSRRQVLAGQRKGRGTRPPPRPARRRPRAPGMQPAEPRPCWSGLFLVPRTGF
uniref:H15 domain-containing protein n=1 Tax=Apteryx owenii TaxID=8824 RepID=A0A8B9QIX6_APTOW